MPFAVHGFYCFDGSGGDVVVDSGDELVWSVCCCVGVVADWIDFVSCSAVVLRFMSWV